MTNFSYHFNLIPDKKEFKGRWAYPVWGDTIHHGREVTAGDSMTAGLHLRRPRNRERERWGCTLAWSVMPKTFLPGNTLLPTTLHFYRLHNLFFKVLIFVLCTYVLYLHLCTWTASMLSTHRDQKRSFDCPELHWRTVRSHCWEFNPGPRQQKTICDLNYCAINLSSPSTAS